MDSTDDFHPLDELLKLPCCSGDKVAQLHAVYDKISVNVRGLEAIGVKADRYGSFLILIIMGNLPADIWLQIARVTTRKVWDVEEVLQIVKWEVEAREINEGAKIHEHKNTDGNKKSLTTTAARLLVRYGHPSNNKKCCV